jgi:ABC-type transporter Mla subunit MlaD
MKLRNASLAKRIFVPTVLLFAVSMTALLGFQHQLYTRSFEATLAKIQDSSLAVKRDGAQGMMQGIKAATERLLQTGEYHQFVELAEQQRKHADIDEIAFVGKNGTVDYATPADRVGKPVERTVWDQAQKADDVVVVEDDQSYGVYAPLRVSADMVRLQPGTQVGQLYGLLHLEFAKTKVNGMLAEARQQFQGSVCTALWVSGGLGAGALVLMGVAMFPLVVRPLVRSLRTVITTLTARSRELVNISAQLTQSSQSLADGASEQASSLEETSSALEEMAAMTRTNAENAKQANALSVQARTAAQNGDQTMTQLNGAMTGINQSSGEISKIIKVIEEIAFQTNLLALNAAVEAARAGEHGKGFAVVADEVRNLAQRAAQAARETTGLIEDSVQKAKQGTDVAGEVGRALAAIVGDVSQVTDLITGIAQASQEQAQGAEQVNGAVSQMDQITQRNAASAEESAAAAEELSGEAQEVNGIVAELVAVVEGARGRAAAQEDTPPAAPPSRRRTATPAGKAGKKAPPPRRIPAPPPSTQAKRSAAGPSAEPAHAALDDSMLDF